MNDCSNTPYNIPSPEPFYAGSYIELPFEISNPYSDSIPDLTFANNIIFTMTLFGNYSSENEVILKFSKYDNIGGLPRIQIDSTNKNVLSIFLYSVDTEDFEDSWYDFQIALSSVSGLEDSVIGQGKIRVYKKIK